jgi:hypothetical protein
MKFHISCLLLPLLALHVGSQTTFDPSTVTITPGPGLPSLESLNLTVADLLSSEVRPSVSGAGTGSSPSVRRRYYCGNSGLGPHYLVNACYNYLQALGNTACVVSTYARSRNTPCFFVARI